MSVSQFISPRVSLEGCRSLWPFSPYLRHHLEKKTDASSHSASLHLSENNWSGTFSPKRGHERVIACSKNTHLTDHIWNWQCTDLHYCMFTTNLISSLNKVSSTYQVEKCRVNIQSFAVWQTTDVSPRVCSVHFTTVVLWVNLISTTD